ncbi:hypothetical protein SODALDRAFT_334582 [Sodiomyces alkalinus F11]|uniref:CFEM domain-containing protein n=1 Tax=Sodiomyces alkalinus (strain CBS 110278 / VKM F-3762 / F11) TaxID=1314773 RepID=A0A3N2PSH8_SODAK|nr:hypothetical protein SODALDRAFT_334582 [Sodiomyces alkalinus F11]ROT37479.1 hypothetical protein SODALDRAFT_334582 [Sodiomyces alkalinus F11]
MQYTIPVIVSLLSALTAAQFPFGDVPSCAVPCLTAAIIESSCEATDNACLCENFNVLRNQVETCAGDGCSPEDIGGTYQPNRQTNNQKKEKKKKKKRRGRKKEEEKKKKRRRKKP